MGSPSMRRKYSLRRIRCGGGARDGRVARTHTRYTTKFSPSATYTRTNPPYRELAAPKAEPRASRLPRGARAEASQTRTSPLKPRLSSTMENKFVRLCVGPGGRPRLWVRGRSFYAAHTMRSGVVRWRCTMGGCGCKAYTQKGTLHKLVGEHNHVGRCGRRPPNNNLSSQLITSISAPTSGTSSPPTPLLVPRLPNFDPNAWIVRY